MTTVRASGSTTSNRAALAAARERALEAAQRVAEEALRRAEQARQAAARAREAATHAAAAATTATGLGRDRPAARSAQESAQAAHQSAQAAEGSAERATLAAQQAMERTNTIAARQGLPPVYPSPEARLAAPVDGFSEAGRRREDAARLLGAPSAPNPDELRAAITASHDYTRLSRQPATAQALTELGITDGAGLRSLGQRLAREAGGGERRATDPDFGVVTDRGALAEVLRTSGNTLPPADRALVNDRTFVSLVAQGQSPAAATSPEARAVEIYNSALSGSQKPPTEWNDADAESFTGALADQVEAHRGEPEVVQALLTLAGPGLQASARVLGQATERNSFDDQKIEDLAGNFSRIGNAAPPETAAQLAYAVASEIDDDSELNHVDDGFDRFIDQGGSAQFRDFLTGALASQGKNSAAEELAAKGGAGGVGDFVSERWEDFTGAVGDAAGYVGDAAGRVASEMYTFVSDEVVGRLGDAVRNAATSVLNLDEQVAQLQSPGDSLVAGANVEGNLLGIQVGAGVQIKITRTESGYDLEVQGEGSAALAEKLNLPGLGEAELEGEATASAAFNFSFENAQQVTDAANTIAGVAAGVGVTAAGGPLAPIGLAMVASAGDEIGAITSHYQSTTLQLEVSAGISADLGERLGLPGASAGATAAQAVAIEIPREGTPRLILRQSMEVEGSLDVAGAVPLPSGGVLSGGRVAGEASIELETSVPIDLDLGRILSDPAGALRAAGQAAVDGATTTLTGDFSFSQGVGVTGPVALHADEGLEVSLSASAPTRDIVGALGMALSGDLGGALRNLSEQVEITGEVRAFRETGGGIGSVAESTDRDASRETDGEGVSIPGLGSLEVTAAAARRTSRVLTHLEGTPAELLEQFGAVIDGVAFRQS